MNIVFVHYILLKTDILAKNSKVIFYDFFSITRL